MAATSGNSQLGSLNRMNDGSNEWQLAVGISQLNVRRQQRVATRIALSQPNRRWHHSPAYVGRGKVQRRQALAPNNVGRSMRPQFYFCTLASSGSRRCLVGTGFCAFILLVRLLQSRRPRTYPAGTTMDYYPAGATTTLLVQQWTTTLLVRLLLGPFAPQVSSVASRIGLAQLNGWWQQRVAIRFELAQLNG